MFGPKSAGDRQMPIISLPSMFIFFIYVDYFLGDKCLQFGRFFEVVYELVKVWKIIYIDAFVAAVSLCLFVFRAFFSAEQRHCLTSFMQIEWVIFSFDSCSSFISSVMNVDGFSFPSPLRCFYYWTEHKTYGMNTIFHVKGSKLDKTSAYHQHPHGNAMHSETGALQTFSAVKRKTVKKYCKTAINEIQNLKFEGTSILIS